MKRALIIGDTIIDEYVFGHATRLCPEGPVPVIVPERTETRGGGARLVANQLEALVGADNVMYLSGSQSKKKRIFADNRLICRLDEDSYAVDEDFETFVLGYLPKFDMLVISDYGKGAFTAGSANEILNTAKVPVLVDAKNNFEWYGDAFAVFPNEHEVITHYYGIQIHGQPKIIQKLGPRGCSVNNQMVPLDKEHDVRDVTGAGDVFLAAFAAMMLQEMSLGDAPDQVDLLACARFANLVAARSVEFVGTKVVTDIGLENG